jgi:hypothetical protein
MPHRTEQLGIDSCQPCQGPGIQRIIFPATLPDQAHIARMRHDHFGPQLGQLPEARKIAAITLIVWKKGVHFDVKHLKPQTA